jgi:hypothetical protein
MANPLIGKTIDKVFLAKDKGAIRFVLDNGTDIIARADGDCCSRSWIENVENAEALIGKPVIEATDVDLDKEDGEIDYEVIRYYGFNISTLGGTCKIDYRNSSNGYYGGNLSWGEDDYFYGGVFGQNKSAEEWEDISDS